MRTRLYMNGILTLLMLLVAGCSSSSPTAAPAEVPATQAAEKAEAPTESAAPAPSGDAITMKSGTIAVILQATSASARWETQDRPRLEAAIKKYAPNATISYANGEGNAANQLRQAEAAITAGAKVLMVAPVDGVQAGEIARKARDAGVKLIAYDALILEAPVDYYVSFDNERVGALMGEYLAKVTKDGDTIVMIGGSPTDNNATLFEKGSLSVLQPMYDAGTRKLGERTLTPEWKLENAQREMEQALSKLDNNVQGVVVGNDNLATGVIAALRAQGLAGKVPVTGQDATIVGLQQIVLGEQGMTVYKAIAAEADASAKLAAYLLDGSEPPAELVNGKVDNKAGEVPSVLLEPVAVTVDNIDSTVVADGFVTWDDICKGLNVTCPPQ